MVKITIKKYKIIDLITLAIIGSIIEVIGVYLVAKIIPWTKPTYCIAVLIIIIAIMRWNSSGLILIPIFSLVGFFAGSIFHTVRYTSEGVTAINYYTVTAFFANFIGLCGCSVLIPIKKRLYKYEFHKSLVGLGAVCFSVLMVVILMQGISLALFKMDGVIESIIFHFINSLTPIVITIVFASMLKNQDVIVDMNEKLLSKSKENRKEKEYYSRSELDFVIKKEKKKNDL